MASESDAELAASIITLGYDLYAQKLYWVAISALWFYEYFLTLHSEIKYAWKGDKTLVFYLFLLNRYLAPVFIIITLVAYFLPAWDTGVCQRYGLMETFETMIFTCLAEIFLTLRVYALAKRHKGVLVVSGLILAWQWAIAIYAMSQSSQGTDQIALLLPRDVPALPTLPAADPYHICVFISVQTVTPWVESYLCLSLAFDGLAFIAISWLTFHMMSKQSYQFSQILQVVQRDGIVYFFVLFSTNLIWLLLLLHARPSLKFIHNQPAMIISSIMINRITLNLKQASETGRQPTSNWSVKTFEHPVDYGTTGTKHSRNLNRLPSVMHDAGFVLPNGFEMQKIS